MSEDMAAAQIDSVVADKEDSIQEEIEELIACETAHPVSAGYLSSKGRSVGEWFASRPWGQMIFKCLDRVLWCFERTMLWQNPTEGTFAPMDRPVNVIVAYPLAAFLWVFQHLMFVGGERTSANELINWVQTRRRRLRAVRFQGIRNMRSNNMLNCPESSLIAQVFWFLGLRPAEAVVAQHLEMKKDSEDYEEEVVPAELGDSEQKKKRRFSAVSDETDDGAALLLDEEYNSESDSDYVPTHSSESDSDSESSSEDELEEEPESTTEKEEEQESATEKEEEESEPVMKEETPEIVPKRETRSTPKKI